MTATNKELQQVPAKTGLGHQFKRDQRCMNSAWEHLTRADAELLGVTNAEQIRSDIRKLMNELEALSYSANERYNQND
jgi:hypothetical protein